MVLFNPYLVGGHTGVFLLYQGYLSESECKGQLEFELPYFKASVWYFGNNPMVTPVKVSHCALTLQGVHNITIFLVGNGICNLSSNLE